MRDFLEIIGCVLILALLLGAGCRITVNDQVYDLRIECQGEVE